MKKLIMTSVAAAFATAFVYGAPTDDVKAAAKKLADAPNYAWTSATEIANSQFPSSPIEGVTEKGGYTVITRSFNGNESKTVRKGDAMALQGREGNWMTRDEMMQQFGGGGGGGGGGRSGRGGRGGFGMFGGGGQTNPAEDAVALAAEAKDLKSEGGAIVGTLGEEAVAQRLAFAAAKAPRRRTPPAP